MPRVILAPATREDAALLIRANLAHLPIGYTQLLLTGMCLLTIILCSLTLSQLPRRILESERQQALHAWQMRLLLDEKQAGAAEPQRPPR